MKIFARVVDREMQETGEKCALSVIIRVDGFLL